MACDLAGCGECLGALYRWKGGGIIRCARHIRLQELWACVPGVVTYTDFKEWENRASISTLAKAMNFEVDLKYWEEVKL